MLKILKGCVQKKPLKNPAAFYQYEYL